MKNIKTLHDFVEMLVEQAKNGQLVKDETRNNLIKALLRQQETDYNRVLSREELQVIELPAINYLLTLLQMRSIDHDFMERVIQLCLNLYPVTRRPIDLPVMQNLVEHLVFMANSHASVREIVEMVLQNPHNFLDRSTQTKQYN